MKHHLTSLLFALTTLTYSHSALAVRWFEVEMIAFEQQPAPLLREDFTLEHDDIEGNNELDLLTKGFNAQGQQYCLQGDSDFDFRSFSEKLSDIGSSRACRPEENYISRFERLPLSPYAEPEEHMEHIYLLAKEQYQFDSVLKKLNRLGLRPILHTGWRFPEQSKRRAPFVKIFAGKKYPSPVSQRLTNTIQTAGYSGLLLQPFETIKEAEPDHWQLEGLIKIHVKHYLYVTTNLDIRYESDDSQVNKARMSQFTRVYSGDIHYLDHPKFGVIFQIRKYKH
jgi:hypothetical protein